MKTLKETWERTATVWAPFSRKGDNLRMDRLAYYVGASDLILVLNRAKNNRERDKILNNLNAEVSEFFAGLGKPKDRT